MNNKIPPEVITNFPKIKERDCITDKVLFKKTIMVSAICILLALFSHILNIDLVVIILLTAFTLMVLTPDKSVHYIYAQIDWQIIFFIIGLNILAGTLEEHGVINMLSQKILLVTKNSSTAITFLFLTANTFLSSLLDNIPIINLAIPIAKYILKEIPSLNPVIWITMAIAANIGANGTIIGAATNLIVAQIAEKNNKPISFWYFFQIGFPLVLIHLLISWLYILLRYLI